MQIMDHEQPKSAVIYRATIVRDSTLRYFEAVLHLAEQDVFVDKDLIARARLGFVDALDQLDLYMLSCRRAKSLLPDKA